MTDCPMSEYAAIDQKALTLLQTELLFALLGEEDVNLLLEGFVAHASSLLVGASLHLDLHMPAAPEDERAVNVHVPGQEGHGRLTMSVVEVAPEGARTLLLELARFIERVLLHAFKGSLLSPGQRAVPQSMIARELHDGVAQELAYLHCRPLGCSVVYSSQTRPWPSSRCSRAGCRGYSGKSAN